MREWWWALILSHDLGYSQRIPKKICLDNRSKHPSWVFGLSTEDPRLLITSALLCYALLYFAIATSTSLKFYTTLSWHDRPWYFDHWNLLLIKSIPGFWLTSVYVVIKLTVWITPEFGVKCIDTLVWCLYAMPWLTVYCTMILLLMFWARTLYI